MPDACLCLGALVCKGRDRSMFQGSVVRFYFSLDKKSVLCELTVLKFNQNTEKTQVLFPETSS